MRPVDHGSILPKILPGAAIPAMLLGDQVSSVYLRHAQRVFDDLRWSNPRLMAKMLAAVKEGFSWLEQFAWVREHRGTLVSTEPPVRPATFRRLLCARSQPDECPELSCSRLDCQRHARPGTQRRLCPALQGNDANTRNLETHWFATTWLGAAQRLVTASKPLPTALRSPVPTTEVLPVL